MRISIFRSAIALWLVCLIVLLAGCEGSPSPSEPNQGDPTGEPPADQGDDGAATKEEQAMKGNIVVTSSAFVQGAEIPAKYTADGEDVSPSLDFEHIPPGTKSLAIICDDPDAPSRKNPRPEGPWVHWVIYNLPTNISPLPEGVARQAEVEAIEGVRQGANSWSKDNVGYLGPSPPPGSGPHRYYFTVYALDTMLDLPAGEADKASLLTAMEGHILDQGALMGTYERKEEG